MKTNTSDIMEIRNKITRIMNLWTILTNDVMQTLREIDSASEGGLPFRRRTFIRTFFACVEGVCYGMRLMCDEGLALPTTYQPDAKFLQKLHEDRLSFIDAVKISFKGFALIFRQDFTLDVENKGYQAFFESKEIRDKLVHPKRAVDLILSPKEIDNAVVAMKWFNDEMVRLSKCPIKLSAPK